MGFVAGAPVAPVVGTVEILNGAVGMVDVVMQLMAAVGAVQQTGEHILLGVLGLPAFRPLPELLYLLPCGGVDNGLMVVLKDGPVFFRVHQAALILEGLGVGLEIDKSAGVLPEGQDFCNGSLAPLAGRVLALFAALADALTLPILRGRQNSILLQHPSCGFNPLPLYAKPVNPADYLGGFIVDDPLSRVVRVFFVAIGRRAHGVTSVAAQLFRAAHLAADVLGVPLVHDVPEGRKIIVTLVAVHTVVYSNKADVVLWKIGVGVISHLQIITSQPGHILYDHGGHITGLYILQHLLEAGAVEICPGVAVICIAACVSEAVVLCVFGEQFLLRRDLSRWFSPKE